MPEAGSSVMAVDLRTVQCNAAEAESLNVLKIIYFMKAKKKT